MPNHFKTSRPLILALILVITPLWLHNSYANEQYQSTIYYSRYTIEEPGYDYTASSLSAGHYFSPVQTGGAPLKLAPFLQRVPRFNIGYIETESSRASSGLDTEGKRIPLSFYYASPTSPHTFSLSYMDAEWGYLLGPTVMETVEWTRTDIRFGSYVNRLTHINLGYTKKEYKSDNSFLFDLESEKELTISASKVLLLENGTAWDLGIGFSGTENSDREKGKSMDASIEYFFNRRFSLEFNLTQVTGDQKFQNGNETGIEISLFVTPRLVIALEAAKHSASEEGYEDKDIIDIDVGMRF